MATKVKKIPFSRLRGLRAERCLSQAQLAKIIGMAESSYVAKENGNRDWRSSEMIRLVKYFKTSLDELFIS